MQEPSDKSHHRAVRSYVLRTGRITSAQQRALDEHWPRFGLEFVPQVLDQARLFGRVAACSLEIGFGNGEHLLERALAQPDRDFLGVEVLRQQIAPGSLDEVQLLFPDPWPKKRHHKRRIVQYEFVALVASRLGSGGRLHLATDWEPYAEEMLLLLNGCGL